MLASVRGVRVRGADALRTSVALVLERRRAGEAMTFIDARREVEWRRATDKLPGAVRIAPDDPEETLPMIPRDRAGIVYCTSLGEASSVAVALLLRASGYPDVWVLRGGLAGWRTALGPLEAVGPLALRAVSPARRD
jgi:rhodanese-related sulfurtransferase